MKKMSNGLRYRLNKTRIKVRERFDYLKNKENKTVEEFREFWFYRDVRKLR